MSERYTQAYDAYKQKIEQAMRNMIPERPETFQNGHVPALLAEAMRYSLLAGGKRIRPVLLLATVEMLGGSAEEALRMAAALEMIHTYSLIHDDLPGMDDDDLRRGRPTNHKVYGVGQAILAGDGLLNMAYEWMTDNALRYPDHAVRHLRAIHEIAVRAGVTGMIAGQCIDLVSENMEPDFERLRYIDWHKTADLLTAPLLAAGYLCGADDEQMKALYYVLMQATLFSDAGISTQTLLELSGVSRPTLLRRLKDIEAKGLLTTTVIGKLKYYMLDYNGLTKMQL